MNMISFDDDLLPSDEVAAFLGISVQTLGRWSRMRKGPARVKIGRSIYYRRSAIERWVTSLEAGSDATVARGRR